MVTSWMGALLRFAGGSAALGLGLAAAGLLERSPTSRALVLLAFAAFAWGLWGALRVLFGRSRIGRNLLRRRHLLLSNLFRTFSGLFSGCRRRVKL